MRGLSQGVLTRNYFCCRVLPVDLMRLVTCNSKLVVKGSSFFAIQNGINYIPSAIENGASRIIIDESADPCNKIEQVCSAKGIEFERVSNIRTEYAHRCANSYGNPGNKLKLIGITGTKGKTTTTHLVAHLLSSSGRITGLLSSESKQIYVNQSNEEKVFFSAKPTLTTESSEEIQYFLSKCVEAGAEYVVIEVSSHALDQQRVYGLHFEVAIFTNLGSDHLDYHKSMEEYFNAKMKLFTMVESCETGQIVKKGTIVINVDHDWGRKAFQVAKEIQQKYKDISILTYMGYENTEQNTQECDYLFEYCEPTTFGVTVQFDLLRKEQRSHRTTFNIAGLLGRYNSSNGVQAILAAQQVTKHQITLTEIQRAFSQFPGISERSETYQLLNGAKLILDFAHNALSFEALFKQLRPFTKKLIIIWGFSQTSVQTRLAESSEIVYRYADVMIYSANVYRGDPPETPEETQNVFQKCVANLDQHDERLVVQFDRCKAVLLACQLADSDSIIVCVNRTNLTDLLNWGMAPLFKSIVMNKERLE